jgi:hypothetical protein
MSLKRGDIKMKTYNYSEAQRNFSSVLNTALQQDVIIQKRDGSKFKIVPIIEKNNQSPFDVTGIDTDISTEEIIEFLKEGRYVSV